jgi:hypothetical protein
MGPACSGWAPALTQSYQLVYKYYGVSNSIKVCNSLSNVAIYASIWIFSISMEVHDEELLVDYYVVNKSPFIPLFHTTSVRLEVAPFYEL